MTPKPTGKITTSEAGQFDLTLTRVFQHATPEDVWASITESDRTARWYGPWRGEAGAGKTIEAQMAFEEGQPWTPMLIVACEPHTRLQIHSSDASGTWNMELRVRPLSDATALDLIQHEIGAEMVGSVGPGWEYYLDMLVSSRNDAPLPSFDDYYPSQQEWFTSQLPGDSK